MKSLKQYIVEQSNSKETEELIFTFNLKGMDDIDDVKKKLEEIDNCSIEDDKVTLTACKDCENTKKAYDILKKYSDSQRSSQHRSSDEQYAQKTLSLKNDIDKLDEFINRQPDPEPEEKEDEKSSEECKDGKCDDKK